MPTARASSSPSGQVAIGSVRPVTSEATTQVGGRPRRFDAETEVRMIVEATTALLARNDYEDVSIGAILTEAGLSTRSFYRHFSSKDELLIALYRENAEQAARRLSGRVATVQTPLQAVESWIDELLSFTYNPRKARRVAIYDAPSSRRAVGYAEAQPVAVKLLIDPLREALEWGLRDGSFPGTVPEWDARSMYALTWDVMRWDPRPQSREALAYILRFVLPTLTARAAC
jgi:AcrR family transcriptional regulator